MPGFRLSKAAQADVQNIAHYTQKEWGRAQRRRYLDGIQEKFEALSLNPTMTAERFDFNPPEHECSGASVSLIPMSADNDP